MGSQVGRFYYRPEPNERKQLPEILRRHQPDGAIISARYRTQPRAEGEEPDGLVHDPFFEAGVPVLDDPDTPVLCAPDVTHEVRAARIRGMPSAEAVELPLDIATLEPERARDHFVEVNVESQSGAFASAAPYLEFDSLDSRAFALSIAMAKRTAEIAPTHHAVAFVQVPVKALLNGVLSDAAPAYAATGVRSVVLRISGLLAEEATADELSAYLGAASSFDAHGLHPIADAVGRLGPLLVAGPAAGFSTGSVRYRRVPATPLSGAVGPASIGLESPFAWRQVRRELAGSELIKECPVTNCRVDQPRPKNIDFRDHNIHYFAYLSRWAARVGIEGVVKELRASNDPYARVWADALVSSTRRAQTA